MSAAIESSTRVGVTLRFTSFLFSSLRGYGKKKEKTTQLRARENVVDTPQDRFFADNVYLLHA